jgi:hypothetical protein
MKLYNILAMFLMVTTNLSGLMPWSGQPVHAPGSARSGGLSSMTSAAIELNISREWRLDLYGSAIGYSGLVVDDIDGDGITEIVAGAVSSKGNGAYWYILRQTGPDSYG